MERAGTSESERELEGKRKNEVFEGELGMSDMKKQMPGPRLVVKTHIQAALFFYATEVPRIARALLNLASNFAAHDSNLYALCDNQTIADALGISLQQLLRSKRQLRDAKLLDYDGHIGDLTPIIERWEAAQNTKWEYRVK
jgi:hypothetical protein